VGESKTAIVQRFRARLRRPVRLRFGQRVAAGGIREGRQAERQEDGERVPLHGDSPWLRLDDRDLAYSDAKKRHDVARRRPAAALERPKRGPALLHVHQQAWCRRSAMTKEEASELLPIAGREVRVTHPSRLYFSQVIRLSKLDLIRYYLAVAEGALRGIR